MSLHHEQRSSTEVLKTNIILPRPPLEFTTQDLHQKPFKKPISHCINIPVNSISLSNYKIGDTTNPLQFANVTTEETKILELKELRVNDAIFVVRLLSPGLDSETFPSKPKFQHLYWILEHLRQHNVPAKRLSTEKILIYQP